MSFFVREKTLSKKNKKFAGIKRNSSQPQKTQKEESDEELDSEDEDNEENYKIAEESDEEDLETPQAKRLRLAKKYLDDIKKSDDEEEDVSKKLKLDYLESVGKLKKYVADKIVEHDSANIKTLKHRLQSKSITCLCISPDDQFLFSGSKSGVVVKWILKDNKPSGIIQCNSLTEDKKKNSNTSIQCMAISTDFKFIAIGDLGTNIQIWNPDTLAHIHTFDGHRDVVNGLAFQKETHQLYSCSSDRSVKIWSLDEMTYIETLFGHQSPVTGIDAMHKESCITSGGSDRSVRIWKIVDESQLVYNGHKQSIDCVRYVNEETFLSCSDDGSLCLWNAMKKKPSYELKLAHGKSSTGDANWITAIATLTNTDLVASGSNDGFIRLWKLDRNFREIKFKFAVPVVGFINSLTFTSDGSFLIAGIGQEHRLGRWWKLKEAKNNILVIPLNRVESV